MTPLKLKQEPYLQVDIFGDTIYKAIAKDIWGCEYEITWPVVDLECQEENGCDWEYYHVRRLEFTCVSGPYVIEMFCVK